MSLDGHIYKIGNAEEFFTPIVLGGDPPSSGYSPWSGLEVTALYFFDIIGLELPIEFLTTTTASNGSFSLPDPVSVVNQVALLVSSPGAGTPLYRTAMFSVSEAETRELNVWLFPDTLRRSDGITAGEVSGVVGGAGLPGNTTITASAGGFEFNGSEGQVSIQFGIGLTPDVSTDLNDFIDLSLNSWDINVDWPTSWFETADDVLNDIRSGLAGAGVSMNTAVLAKMETIIETEDGLPSSLATEFFSKEVSVTFMDVKFPTNHTWGIGDNSDGTVVVEADPCIGYPRNLSSDPAKPHRSRPRKSRVSNVSSNGQSLKVAADRSQQLVKSN